MRLLDTTFLIGYERGREAVASYLANSGDEEFVTSTVCMKELAVGNTSLAPRREPI
ncbi:PIN domain-containing protein [Halalkalicoccus ordinarius]|uniref:hypothetical protein n=1 Tax=Halalkalicoccus ordinarius TaxID=3116651 RepID=UPI00300F1738